MQEQDMLGVNIHAVLMDGIIFHVRGLTVLEMINLQTLTNKKTYLTPKEWLTIAYRCVVGWSNYIVNEDDEYFEVDFSIDALNRYVNPLTIAKLGEYAYTKLTILSDEEMEKFRAYVRFIFWISDKKHGPTREKSYDCDHCVKTGMIMGRNCGRPDRDNLIKVFKESKENNSNKQKVLNKPKSNEVVISKTQSKERQDKNTLDKKTGKKFDNIKDMALNKYGAKKNHKSARNATKEQREEREVKNFTPEKKIMQGEEIELPTNNFPKEKKLVIGNYTFLECPVSWVDPWMKTLTDVLYDCAKHGLPFFEGGASAQSYKLYRIQKTVAGEANSIENEELEKERKSNKKK
jgi:hypothetical protein